MSQLTTQLAPTEAVLMNVQQESINVLNDGTDINFGGSHVSTTSSIFMTSRVKTTALTTALSRMCEGSEDPEFTDECQKMKDSVDNAMDGTKSKLYVLIDKGAGKRKGNVKIYVCCFRSYEVGTTLACDYVMLTDSVTVTPDYAGLFTYMGLVGGIGLAAAVMLPEMAFLSAIGLLTGLSATSLTRPVADFLNTVAPGQAPAQPLKILLEASVLRSLMSRGLVRLDGCNVIVNFREM